MDKIYNRALVIDGSYIIHRALSQEDVFDLKTSKGERTGGIFVSLKMLNREIRDAGKYYPVVCFDSGLSPRRVELDPDYKNARERALPREVLTPEELDNDYVTQYRKQRNALIEILTYFGIPCLKFPLWEGDDLMYIVSKLCNRSLILTDDRDLLQLLTEGCNVRRPMADELWTEEEFLSSQEYENMDDFIMCKALLGDASDNIVGSCKGVGKTTVNHLINLLKLYKNNDGEFDFSNYPTDEKLLREICTDANIKYRKAYLNFDEERFYTNLKLVDIREEDISRDNIVKHIISNINNCRHTVDYFKAVGTLGRLEIKEFPIDELMSNVSNRYINLKVDGNE